jgi:predicted transcriptional regulator
LSCCRFALEIGNLAVTAHSELPHWAIETSRIIAQDGLAAAQILQQPLISRSEIIITRPNSELPSAQVCFDPGKSVMRFPLCRNLPGCLRKSSGDVNILGMTDKQAVMDAIQRLPDNSSLEEISEELRIMAAIRRGREDVAAGRTKTHAEAEHLLESWATGWTSR